MLNMKKGLALVLAAATAFTFAPVSTLGLPVAAYAEQAKDTTVWSGTLSTGKVYSFDLSATQKEGVSYNLILTYGKDKVTVAISNGKYYNIPNTKPNSIKANDTITGAATATNATTSPSAATAKASVASALFNEVTANAAETTYDSVGAKITARGVESGESVSVSVFDNGEASADNDGTVSDKVSTKNTVVADENATSRTGNPEKALKDELKIPVTAFGDGDGTGKKNSANNLNMGASIKGSTLSIDGVDSITRLNDGSGFFISGLKLQGDKNAEYTLADAAGLTFFKNGSQAVTKATTKDTLVKSSNAVGADKVVGSADENGVLTVDVYVSSSGDHKFTLANDFKTGQGNKQNAEIKFNISADDMQLIDGLDIRKDSDSSDTSMKDTDNGLYELTLNDGKYGYYITGLAKDTTRVVRTWTGVDVKSKVTVSPYNEKLGYLEATGSIITGNGYNAEGTNYNIKAGNVTTAPVELTVHAENDIAVAKLKVTVDRSNEGIDSITYTNVAGKKYTVDAAKYYEKNNDYFYFDDYENDSQGQVIKTHPTFTLTGLNKQVNNKGSFSVKAESGKITYRSEDSSIVSINDDGTFTVQGVGKTTIHITSDGTVNNKAVDARINVEVEDWARDIIKANFDDSGSGSDQTLYLDVAGQKNGKPVFTGTLHVKSYGSLPYKVSTDSKYFSIADDGNGNVTVKSGADAGTGTITITTTTDTAKRIHGASTYVTVIVWDVPAAEYTKTPVVLAKGQSELLGQYLTVTNPNPSSVRWDYGTTGLYTLSNPENGGLREDLNNQTTSRITATAAGQGTVKATIAGVAGKTRPTVVSLDVAITDSTHANVIVLGDTKSLTLTEGDAPVTVTASSTIKADVAFASSDSTVATVAAGATSGSAIVTAVKAGKTTIKVTSEGAETVEIPVIVSAKSNGTDAKNETKVPGKVAKIKLYNVKGAKLKINYSKIKGVDGYKVVYKYKKNGKLVRKTYVTTAGSKTVSVPKNTSVKVWVRAYNVNSDGQRVNGAYKTATKKTDKK